MPALSPSSSSTTTPSPSLPFLQPPGVGTDSPTLQLADLDPQEREERQRAVQKFLARAECSKLTRGLRARLAYASYKATHNLSHVPLPVLEHRIQPPSPSPAPSSSVPSSPYSTSHKRRADTMPPPASPSRSLYASLLGPPPSKRARHVYGPEHSPTRRKAPASPFVNGGQGRTVRTVLQGRARSHVTEKEDMNAAATLTALMFNRASPRQPRLKKGGVSRADDGGASHTDEGGISRTSSGTSLLGPPRTTTPAPEGKPTEDADAAELMLYLATSPSPARPTTGRRTGVGMGRVLFAQAADRGEDNDREPTPGLTMSQSSLLSSQQSSLPSSQETQLLLPPPPSPSSHPSAAKKASPFDVSRRLFVDSDMADMREGAGGFGTVEGLGKGIDLVEAK